MVQAEQAAQRAKVEAEQAVAAARMQSENAVAQAEAAQSALRDEIAQLHEASAANDQNVQGLQAQLEAAQSALEEQQRNAEARLEEVRVAGQQQADAARAEAEQAITDYSFSSDGTLVLSTVYGQSIAEERIWFASDNVRCRSSVLKTSEGSGILQTSFASEVRKISKA